MMTHPASTPCNSGPSTRLRRRFNVCMARTGYRLDTANLKLAIAAAGGFSAGRFASSGPRSRERHSAQKVSGGAADAVGLDGGRELEIHPHRLRELGGPAQIVAF